MAEIKNIILSMSVTLIFFGVVSMLLPEGSLTKSFNSFRSVVIVATVAWSVIGVSGAVAKLDFSELDVSVSNSATELLETVDELNLTATESAVIGVINENFELKGVSNTEIKVFTNKTEDNCISIVKVQVVCDKENKTVCEDILKALGLEFEVLERQ